MIAEQEQSFIDEIQQEDTTKDKFLTFMIEKDEYGIEIAKIKEIISVRAITAVPETPDYLMGIINLRGNIIPAIDVRVRFAKETRPYDDMTCIVVIEFEQQALGLIVDVVKEVLYIHEENILPPPSAKLNHYNQFIKSIGRIDDRIVMLMDLDRFLSREQ